MKRYLYQSLDEKTSWMALMLNAFDPDDDGGGDDGDTDEDESDDEDEDESDDDKGKGKGEDVEARLKKLERSLRRARGESQKWKRIANSNADKGDDKNKDDDGPDYRTAALTQAGVNALVGAGFTGSSRRAERLLATISLDDIEADSRGRFDPDDFADAIEDIKDEFPELFRSEDDDSAGSRRRPASRVNRSTGSSSSSSTKLTSDQRFALSIAKQAGYGGLERRIREGR